MVLDEILVRECRAVDGLILVQYQRLESKDGAFVPQPLWCEQCLDNGSDEQKADKTDTAPFDRCALSGLLSGHGRWRSKTRRSSPTAV